jgi:hypothetical protein
MNSKVRNLRIASALIIAISSLTMVSCNNCKSEDPRSRIVNNGTAKASVQIWTTGGNTENINNIEVGQTSDWRTFAPGLTNFTVSIQGEADTVITTNMLTCFQYDIKISANNTVSAWSEDLQ